MKDIPAFIENLKMNDNFFMYFEYEVHVRTELYHFSFGNNLTGYALDASNIIFSQTIPT